MKSSRNKAQTIKSFFTLLVHISGIRNNTGLESSLSTRITSLTHALTKVVHDNYLCWFTGSTKFKPAFGKAFDLLQRSVSEDSGKKRKRVILFLTDGAPTDENEIKDLFETIRDRNVELNNSVIILTYGFNKYQEDILIEIANQNGTKHGVAANTSVGDVAVMQKFSFISRS